MITPPPIQLPMGKPQEGRDVAQLLLMDCGP